MAKAILSQDAQSDLVSIYRQGLELFGEKQAGQYLDTLFHLFDLLGENPGMGSDFDIQGKHFQRFVHVSHVIIFETSNPGVKILRIFHGASDYFKSL